MRSSTNAPWLAQTSPTLLPLVARRVQSEKRAEALHAAISAAEIDCHIWQLGY
jgi:hypothetical protein